MGGLQDSDMKALQQLVVQTVLDAEHSVLTDPRCDCNLSGTTVCAVIITASSLVCINVGDSRAVVGGPSGMTALSWDQTPAVESEVARIVVQHGADRIGPARDVNGEAWGPTRVWIGEKKSYGLTMTRFLSCRVEELWMMNIKPENPDTVTDPGLWATGLPSRLGLSLSRKWQYAA